MRCCLIQNLVTGVIPSDPVVPATENIYYTSFAGQQSVANINVVFDNGVTQYPISFAQESQAALVAMGYGIENCGGGWESSYGVWMWVKATSEPTFTVTQSDAPFGNVPITWTEVTGPITNTCYEIVDAAVPDLASEYAQFLDFLSEPLAGELIDLQNISSSMDNQAAFDAEFKIMMQATFGGTCISMYSINAGANTYSMTVTNCPFVLSGLTTWDGGAVYNSGTFTPFVCP